MCAAAAVSLFLYSEKSVLPKSTVQIVNQLKMSSSLREWEAAMDAALAGSNADEFQKLYYQISLAARMYPENVEILFNCAQANYTLSVFLTYRSQIRSKLLQVFALTEKCGYWYVNPLLLKGMAAGRLAFISNHRSDRIG